MQPQTPSVPAERLLALERSAPVQMHDSPLSKRAVAQFESIAYTGVILNDLSREESRAYRTSARHRTYRFALDPSQAHDDPSIQDRNPTGTTTPANYS